MDGRTLEALKASIAKWERNAVAERPNDYKTGSHDCPLCRLFNPQGDDFASDCVGCPVAAKTGEAYCDGTPYPEANRSWAAWYSGNLDERSREAAGSKAREAALVEVAFLKSLLPPEEQVP